MNFLAHIYLSGEDDFLKIGNFMADGIRYTEYHQFPERVVDGIYLHHKIDLFTDTHPITKASKDRLFGEYGHYAAVIVDMYYDHFLAKNWHRYHSERLEKYVQDFYDLLYLNHAILSSKAQYLLPHMVENNWLVSYQTIEGLGKIMTQMDERRTDNRSRMRFADQDLRKYYRDFEQEFFDFFDELEEYVKRELK